MASDQSVHDELSVSAAASSPGSQVRAGSSGLDETTHLRVSTCPSSPAAEYRTFDDCDDVVAGTITRAESGDSSPFRPRRVLSSTSLQSWLEERSHHSRRLISFHLN